MQGLPAVPMYQATEGQSETVLQKPVHTSVRAHREIYPHIISKNFDPSGGSTFIKKEPYSDIDEHKNLIDLSFTSCSPRPNGASRTTAAVAGRHSLAVRPPQNTGVRNVSRGQGQSRHLSQLNMQYQDELCSEDSEDSSQDSGTYTDSSCSSGPSGTMSGNFTFPIPQNSFAAITNINQSRARREFVPDYRKDAIYWNKRLKNNDSARRSRIKRKAMEKLMEHRMVELQKENMELRYELNALKRMFGDQTPTDLNSPSPSSSSSQSSVASNSASISDSNDRSDSSSPLVTMDDEHRQTKSSDAPVNGTDVRCPSAFSTEGECRLPQKQASSLADRSRTEFKPLADCNLHFSTSAETSRRAKDSINFHTTISTTSDPLIAPCPRSNTVITAPHSPDDSERSRVSASDEESCSGWGGFKASFDDIMLHKIPLKCRMKQQLRSAFASQRQATRESVSVHKQ